jgi:hypothetical protein
VVVGVSDEGMGMIEKHIEKTGMEYPIARIKPKFDDMYGVKGFPHSALIDANGRIIWKGHPAKLPMDKLRDALDETAHIARLEGKRYGSINKLIEKRQFGKALAAAEKGLTKGDDEGFASVKESVEALVERMSERAKAAREADYAEAWSVYGEMVDLFAGLPAADEAKAQLKKLESDPQAKKEITAFRMLLKADKVVTTGDFAKAARKYKSIAKKYANTSSGRDAQEFLNRHRRL